MSLQAQQQKQQVYFTEKIAACTTSSTTPFDREGLKKEIVQEVRGDSRAGVPVSARPSVPLAAALVTPHESDKFVPRRWFIKGFCNYGCEADQGISEASATTAATSLLTHLRVEYRKLLAENNGGIMARRLRNSQSSGRCGLAYLEGFENSLGKHPNAHQQDAHVRSS